MYTSIKMIVTDLDGTLLRDDKTVSKLSKETLHRCREFGTKIVFATGRGRSGEHIVPLEYFDGQIVNNGALAYAGNSLVYNRLIQCEMARPLLIACNQRGLKTAAQLNNVHYSNFDVIKEWSQFREYELVDFSLYDKETEKIYSLINSQEDTAFINSILPNDLYMTVSREGMAMIMHKDATKSAAATALAQYWGISQSEIVAFGDDVNDIDLLTSVGIGIAMGNALSEVKAAADFVCLSNEEDGLAKWLMSSFI